MYIGILFKKVLKNGGLSVTTAPNLFILQIQSS